jgi:hypothetical protein
MFFAGYLVSALVAGDRVTSAEEIPISFELVRPTVTVNEPVSVEFSIRNNLEEEIRLDLGFDRAQNFEFVIGDPRGTKFPLHRNLGEGGVGRSGKVSVASVAPGQGYSQKILISDVYAFAEPGQYTLWARMAGSIVTQSGRVIPPQPERRLVLTVHPRDAHELEGVCEGLAQSATSENAEAALEAASALSSVRDLVAVPYLQRLTREGPFLVVVRPKAINGLARIAAAAGVENVASRLRPPDPELERLIRQIVQPTAP